MLYEYPLNERTRLFLRCETLLNALQQMLVQWQATGSPAQDQVTAPHSQSPATEPLLALELRLWFSWLVDLLNLLERYDLKTELLKELERCLLVLHKMAIIPELDQTSWQQTIEQLNQQFTNLSKQKLRALDLFKGDMFLSGLKNKTQLAISLNSFELPGLYGWLYNLPAQTQLQQLDTWLSVLQPMAQALRFLLKLMRSSSEFEQLNASSGLYQRDLEAFATKKNFLLQLIRIKLSNEFSVYPEFSGNKSKINLRFVNINVDAWSQERAKACNHDVQFMLACCGF